MSTESKAKLWRYLALGLLCLAVGAVVLVVVPTARGAAVAALAALAGFGGAAMRGRAAPRVVATREPRKAAEAEAERQRADLDALGRRESAAAAVDADATRDKLLGVHGESLAEILRRDLGGGDPPPGGAAG